LTAAGHAPQASQQPTVATARSPQRTRVIVGMSGGVDSSLAAALLVQAGYQVEGLFMKNWDEDDGTDACTAMADLEDATAVANTLGIKLHTASFAAEYWDRVFEHFLQEYAQARTPNPDILCNREIKFKAFLEYAQTLGADYIATGHYAQTAVLGDQTWLMKGADPAKDQSYFLHAVPQAALAKTLFPLGGMIKTEVRRLAADLGLITHDKKDSTGICFIGERKFSDFLKTYLPAQPGDIVTEHGDIIGRHQGLMYHTIGQRQGLHIGGLSDYGEAPWYVARKNLDDNTLTVVQGSGHPLLFRSGLTAGHLDWVAGSPPPRANLMAKIRYRQPDVACTVSLHENQAEVRFDLPQRAVTPGQSIVFYDGLRCLGGGIIL